MEYTTQKRKEEYINFTEYLQVQMRKKDANGDYLFYSTFDAFNLEPLSEGVEGKVYKTLFKVPSKLFSTIVLKQVNLKCIKDSKDISKTVMKASTKKLYDLIYSKKLFKCPSVIELISQTCTNQLIFQGISPHYSLNYYWEYEHKDKIISSFNEYANGYDFEHWSEQKRSDKEWFNALFQIMYGLIALKKYFNMLHTDFHAKNILIRKVTPGGYWKYIVDDVTYYVPNLGFVVLIHDFGFSWIENKMYVKWHFKNTLSYATKNGKEFYDLAYFIQYTVNHKSYKAPKYFKQVVKKSFTSHEVSYIFTKEFYKVKYKRERSTDYFKIFKKYPNVESDFITSSTLKSKLFDIFHSGLYFDNLSDVNYKDLTYGDKEHQTQNSFPIETYSVDIPFRNEKLPQELKTLLQ